MPREERLARNEVLFREVNENIRRLSADFGGDEPQRFVCECATAGCVARLLVTISEYERVRANGTHFLVMPGHEDIELEQVIVRHPRFVVVEKDGAAGAVADEEDPRALP